MGLNTLTTVLEKRGPEYVERFLDEKVIITEKLDTYRILFENVDGELKFFKKDNTEISLVERTLTDVWETAIEEIPILVSETKLPEGIRFGVAYTPVERPIRIPYSNLPSYVLTDVTKRKDNRILEVYDYDEVKNWAGILNMARPPIIFEGVLTKEQKKILLAYDKKEFEGTEDNFSMMLEKWIGKPYSGEDTIEGIIIKGKDQVAQVVSYEFKLLEEAYKDFTAEGSSRDLYDLVLISLNQFMDTYQIPLMEGKSSDQIYINIISDIYNQYCKRNPISESLDSKYLTPPAYGHKGKINTKFIENEDTLETLKKGEIYESLFKVFLSSLRKFKKKYGLITEKECDKFNTHVYMVNLHSMPEGVNSAAMASLNESTVHEAKSENVVVKAFDQKKHSDVDNMRVIASIQKAFDPKELNVKRGANQCVVYLADMTPFTKSQMENIYAINRSWKVPVIIVTVSSKRRKEGIQFHFSDALLKAQLDAISIFNKDIIPNYFMMDGYDLTEIFEFSRPTFEPIALITDKGKKGDFVIQLYFEDEVMGGRIGAEPEFNVGEMDVEDKLKAFRSIEDNLNYNFREFTPQAVHGLFDSMVTEYKTWSGQYGGVRDVEIRKK